MTDRNGIFAAASLIWAREKARAGIDPGALKRLYFKTDARGAYILRAGKSIWSRRWPREHRPNLLKPAPAISPPRSRAAVRTPRRHRAPRMAGANRTADPEPHRRTAPWQLCAVRDFLARWSPRCRASNWRAVRRNTLQGFETLNLPSGLVLHECSLHAKAGKRRVGLPSKPQLDSEGRHRKDPASGKSLYSPTVQIPDKQIREKFNVMALAAIDRVLGPSP